MEERRSDGKQRIYVGGLDPSRGLTVELVASRLQSVEDVEIISINDVAIKNRDDVSCISCKPISNPKHRIIDEDGDFIDTRNYFYIEARATDAKRRGSSALELLAKQYHNTKWKGCLLRVEEAKPHILKRLECEREERDVETAAAAALSIEIKESTAKEGAKEAKQRRRLKIRQRFGEEAFRVDTYPRQLQLDNESNEGWNDFASLRKRMINKLESQRKLLVDRRKKERRSWTGGKCNKENASSESNDLRSLTFLNRGIHIRFDSIGATDLTSDNNSSEDVGEDDDSSSSSDPDESSIIGEDHNHNSYVWSDDGDNDEDNSADINEEDVLSSESREEDGHEKSDNDGDSIDKKWTKPTKTSNMRGGAQCMKTIVADEFSFGVDFDFLPSNEDTVSVHSDNVNTFNESLDVCLEDDISSNMNILSKLFPEDSFDIKPLAASIYANDTANRSDFSREQLKFGSGLIMQRYDPTKDTDKRFENIDPKVGQAREKFEEKRYQEQNEELSSTENVSLSSESSESSSTKDACDHEEKTATDASASKNAAITKNKDIYEQDELENVFKKSRQAASTNFSFGFQVPLEAKKHDRENVTTQSYSVACDEAKVAKETSVDGPSAYSDKVEDALREKTAPKIKRVRRVGLTIPECDLDEYEDLFFSLNEGSQILKNLDAMKKDEDNQNLWQKERVQLTSDWKRKQKAALSRKVKKIRR